MLNSAKDTATNKTAPRRARALAFESLRAGFRKALKRFHFCLTAAVLTTIPAWPQEAPITLCVFRQDPFGGALDEIVRGKTINNREVLARQVNELPTLKACQLVFVSGREDKLLSEILDSLKGASALVIGESEGFAERGGGIQFFLEDNKLRFAVNVDAVQRASLTVSSKLLGLARIAHDNGHLKGS